MIFVKKVSKSLLIGFCVITLLLTGGNVVNAASKTASASYTQKSWVGIPVYTKGVKGDYVTNSTKITSYGTVRSANSTHYPGWSVKSQSAYWVTKGTTSGKCRGTATFFYGLNTQWVTVGLQSNYTEIQAYASK